MTELHKTAEGFEIRTQDETYRARQVVVATGPFQVPFVPPAAQRLDGSVTQLHSAGYRNPQALPPGPVLVVGGGNSGFQIAEELAAAGRQVDLSIGTKMPVLPQRLAGRDLFWWLTRLRTVAGQRGVPAWPADVAPGFHHRQQPPPAAGGWGPVPARRGRGTRAHRPLHRRHHARRRHRRVGHGLPLRLLLDRHSRRRSRRHGDPPPRRHARYQACTSWACHGSTPAARRYSASSATTPPTSPAASATTASAAHLTPQPASPSAATPSATRR